MDVASIAIVTIAASAALIFTIVPIVPGTLLVVAAAVAVGALEGFATFSTLFWVGQGICAAVYLGLDNLIQIAALRRIGSSNWALVGSTVGVFAGVVVTAPVLGPFAVLFGPPIGAVGGAVAGQLLWQRRNPGMVRIAVRSLGLRSLVAYVLGTALKLAIVVGQVATLVIAAT